MKLSEALESVNQFYVPGIVAYYAQLKPDPWQAAHDDLEQIAGTFDPDIVSPAAHRFVERCKGLVQRFMQDAQPSRSVSPADAFAMSRASVDAHLSRKFKRCARCDTREGLKIVPMSPGSMDVQLLCPRHMGAA